MISITFILSKYTILKMSHINFTLTIPARTEQRQQQQPQNIAPRPLVPRQWTPQSASSSQAEQQPAASSQPTPSSGGSVTWTDPALWILLRIMNGVNEILINGVDNSLKKFIWINAFNAFKSQIVEESAADNTFLANITVAKIQSKWSTMKARYSKLREENGLTGVGGVSPDANFRFYNEVGQAFATPMFSLKVNRMTRVDLVSTSDKKAMTIQLLAFQLIPVV